MKKNITIIFLFILFSGVFIKWKYYSPSKLLVKDKHEVQSFKELNLLKNGDIIFQNSLSSQSRAVEMATHSKYTHCGIIYIKIKIFMY